MFLCEVMEEIMADVAGVWVLVAILGGAWIVLNG
jgi:hypothetical protein